MIIGTKTLLLVDGDRDVMEMTRRIIERRGYSVRCTCGLREARDALAVYQPNVIVMDLELPDGDGLELLRDLRQYDDPPKTLMLSGAADDEIPVLNAGADDWMHKPYNCDIFFARLAVMTRMPEELAKPAAPPAAKENEVL